MTSSVNKSVWAALICTCLILSAACAKSESIPPSIPLQPSVTKISATKHPEFTQDQILSLESLEKVDEYPLYIMHYYADYENRRSFSGYLPNQKKLKLDHNAKKSVNPWSCSLFAAFGDPEYPLFGRNFDWRYSPALLLYTHPKDGNASVSMVDIEYLVAEEANNLLEIPIEMRLPLLAAPEWPFDGMNACGLVIGMAAVPSGGAERTESQKPDIGSLEIIREILDHTCTVDEAIELLEAYNVIWDGGPALHYLIADGSGKAVLIEFLQGEIQVIPDKGSWHQATNFLLSTSSGTQYGICDRYDTISDFLLDKSGILKPKQAMALLSQVSQDSTQWSVVYNITNGEIQIVMGKHFGLPHTFQLDMDK